MCNAYNHSFDCSCGFGGDTGGGWGRARAIIATTERISAGWARDSRGTVESYVNPNAHCPVCGELVYFYRSPYDGRVFFDALGWPWPKHACTDNSREPRRATRDPLSCGIPRAEPNWRIEGWHPLLSSEVSDGTRLLITGDFHDEFLLELCLLEDEAVDRNSPILVREQTGKSDVFEITFLRSNRFNVDTRRTIAFRSRIAPLGDEIILKAARNDPTANHKVGLFVLWRLDDPIGARPYLQRAVAGGIADALIDLAIVELFSSIDELQL